MITTNDISDLIKDRKVYEDYPHTQRKKESGNTTSNRWIQGAIKHTGALHEELNVPMGKKNSSRKTTERYS